MILYSFLEEFGNCSAGMTGVENLATTAKTITSIPVESLLKSKNKKVRKHGAPKKCDTRVKSLVK